MTTQHDVPTVTVIIPTYYRNSHLRNAIESVVHQEYEDIELIVVDDSGEGHARSIVSEYDITYIESETNEGANRARTRGIERSTGTYVQLLDDDDRLHETKIARHVELLDRKDEVGVAYCGMTYEHGRTVHPRPSVRGDVLKHALGFEMSPCLTSTMLIETRLLTELLPLADRPGADDLGLMIELARRTTFEYLDESLVLRSVIEGSRGKSIGVVQGRKQILDEYDELYRRSSSGARASACADTYLLEGRIRLRRNVWSRTAITAFAKAWYHEPTVESTALLAASLFGRPGLRLASHVYHMIASEKGG